MPGKARDVAGPLLPSQMKQDQRLDPCKASAGPNEMRIPMNEFVPINATASGWGRHDEPGVKVLNEEDREEITELLMGHKVTKVDGEHLMLDNGTVIKAIGHDGGCACNAGCYDLSVLNGVDNIITRVEYDYRPAGDGEYPQFDADDPDAPGDKWTGYYRIFVFAEDQRVNLMQFDGTDGNGYYGTGYEILVRPAEVTA